MKPADEYSNDFVMTIHALDRARSRFPELGEIDEEIAHAVYEEVIDALEAGRHAKSPPRALRPWKGTKPWKPMDKESYFAWVPDRSRGYVIRDDKKEGLMVLTVLRGGERPSSW